MPVRLIALLALAACSGGPIDRKRLYAAVDDLAAVAAEARMMVVEEQRGLPAAYAEGQRADLAKRARDALGELDRGVEDAGLEPVRRQAADVGFQMTRVVTTAREPGALGAFAGQLAHLAAEVSP